MYFYYMFHTTYNYVLTICLKCCTMQIIIDKFKIHRIQQNTGAFVVANCHSMPIVIQEENPESNFKNPGKNSKRLM